MAPQSERRDSQSLLEEARPVGTAVDEGHCFRHGAMAPQKARVVVAREQSFVIRDPEETNTGSCAEPKRSDSIPGEMKGRLGGRMIESAPRSPVAEEVTAVTKFARAGVGRVVLRGLAFVENHRPLVMLVSLGLLFFLASLALISRRW
ncbi:MAG: hypothetical protein QM784_38735 [Polyangiaceae bacterium]